MNDWACLTCRRAYAKGQPNQICGDCRRHMAYGVIVYACVGNGVGLEVLDALSTLMGTATRLRRQHNREVFDEQREAHRDASAAYSEGLAHGQGHSRGDVL
jgi:hypothetical protein